MLLSVQVNRLSAFTAMSRHKCGQSIAATDSFKAARENRSMASKSYNEELVEYLKIKDFEQQLWGGCSRMPPREPVDMDEVMRYREKLDAELQQVRANRRQAEAAADLVRLAVGFVIARHVL
jgi:hypothetical protein